MKKAIMLLLVIILSINVPLVIASSINLKDLSGHWANKEINILIDKGIVNSFIDGTFKPENKIQRDQFIKMVVVSLGYNLNAGTSYWAQPYIDKAIELGLFKKGDFLQYNVPMTREQMAYVVVNAALLKETAPSNNLDDYIIKNTKDFYARSFLPETTKRGRSRRPLKY